MVVPEAWRVNGWVEFVIALAFFLGLLALLMFAVDDGESL
jgi:hypothetical protein